ncbi:hypothetical protein PHLGIDRAFT_29570 [Phlebiopsis gigantea 11061_1 CR5-6]|uniref:BSD domain-containing protein n=1 Tax=Phlebiopsis gigantea (strain 11061_1 CR5-6) TaxID=745531 RepID=A0A0C3S0H8_PHLG1|nr:hypothetical protein PHLGIDRAFT_29570 [Phlebiopsis gigantea 11061_1 CR5-6]
MPSSTLTAKASYKKLPGTLELTSTHLQWTQDGKKAPSIRIPHVEAASLFCSKEGAAQVRLKIGLVSDDAGHNFTFLAPQPVAVTEREKFKTELTNIIGVNRRGPNTPSVVPSPITPVLAQQSSNAPSSRPAIPMSRSSTSRAPSVAASDSRRTGTPMSDPTSDYQLRIRVLLSNPELAALHRELVMSRQITENEFWEGREHILLAQAAQESQRKGKSGQLVDPRPQTVDGEIKIVITPQLKLDIFEEYPVVKKAFEENVDKKLSEPEFWHRYFQSKLFNAHRASIRSSAAQHVVRDDPIFDKYLEKDDDELEPRRLREDRVDIFIDLGATLEDHGETGNDKDVTMQAGKQRAVLPLIRKFNEHSGRLLDSVLGEGPTKRRRIEGRMEERYSQLDLEDLHDNQSAAGIALNMGDSKRYFEGRSGDASQAAGPIDVKATIHEAKTNLQGWSANLIQLKIDKKAGDTALSEMTQNVAARLDVKLRKEDIPEVVYGQMMACQTAANEFLRQFWLAIYPPPSDLPTASAATPAQKAAKATKMIAYLDQMSEKVNALAFAATQSGVDGTKIRTAMKPVLDAVEKATTFWRARNSAAAPAPHRR